MYLTKSKVFFIIIQQNNRINIIMDDIFYDEQEQQRYKPIDLNQSDMFNNAPAPNLNQSIKVEFLEFKKKVDCKQDFSVNGNNKNKYINRIKAMTKEMSVNSNLIQKSNPQDQQSEMTQNQNSEKKSKNRKSAKMSRERKKVYMQLLEAKVADLEKQINKKREELDSTQSYLQRLVSQNQTMSGYAMGRQQLLKKLEKLVEGSPNPDINEINTILDSMRYKIGTSGKERLNTINEYFKQIVNVSFPALHRYLMWTASKKKHLFADHKDDNGEEEEWFKELDEKLGLSEEQKRQIQSRRLELQQQKNTLIGIINKLHDTKLQIQKRSEEVEEQIDKIRKILTPLQCAKFCLFIEKNKYRKQLNIWEKKRQPTETTKQEVEDNVSKKRKYE